MRAAAPGTLPALVPHSFGLAVYRWLDRVAPAPFVEATLAQQALDAGDPETAQRYALRLPPSPARDELLARVAAADGDSSLALEYWLAAPDVDAVQARVDTLGTTDPRAAYDLEGLLKVRLEGLRTHPDAVAETSFRMGELANVVARRERPGSSVSREWFARGMGDLDYAAGLSPLDDKYLISAANQAVLLGRLDRAGVLFAQTLRGNPASADAVAGLGVVAYQRGNYPMAAAYLARARALDPGSAMVLALERELRTH